MDKIPDGQKPVPQPRRQNVASQAPTSYENVTIDLINKNLSINDDNLQCNRKSKIQNNKTFLMPSSTDLDYHRNVITEVNILKSSDRNKNISDTNKLNNIYEPIHNQPSLSIPIPAPRRTATIAKCSNEDVYENANQCGSIPEKPIRNSKLNSSCSSLGAISKTQNSPRQPPQLPLPLTPDERRRNSERKASADDTDNCEPLKSYRLPKSTSNTSLNSSTSSHSTGGESPSIKYTTTSPGALLKSLGATSKLLTESITERMTVRTKGAKHKIEKIHKSSKDKISETANLATLRLKNVRKSLHENLSLGRPSHKKDVTTEYDLDRPQTVPADDELFQSISFNSPLQKKITNCYDLTGADDASYEVPKKPVSITKSDEGLPRGTYKVLDENSLTTTDSDSSASLSSGTNNKYNRLEDDSIKIKSPVIPAIPKKTTNKQLNKLNDEKSIAGSQTSSDEIPCPNFPPPIHQEPIYGQLIKSNVSTSTDSESSPVQAPIRQKRRKDYESHQIRLKPVTGESQSNRATADSNEFNVGDGRIFSRNITSFEYNANIDNEEKMITSPARSESWSFYDTTNDDRDCSSPEPIYANDGSTSIQSESVYGLLYNSQMAEDGVLTPSPIILPKSTSKILDNNPLDIIKEFDPLNSINIDNLDLNFKSNELILLENLLGQDTYGTTTLADITNDDSNIADDISDSGDFIEEYDACIGPPPTPTRDDSLLPTSSKFHIPEIPPLPSAKSSPLPKNKNTTIPTKSIEDIANEENTVTPFLAKVEDKPLLDVTTLNDLSRPTTSRSNWFIDESIETTEPIVCKPQVSSPTIVNKLDNNKMANKLSGNVIKLPTPQYDPPSYTEAIAEGSNVSVTTNEAIDEKQQQRTSKSMKSMISNVFNMTIRRKTSFRESSSKSEVKTIIEMVSRPLLTQRLILHEGNIVRLPSRAVDDILKEQQSRKAFIRDRKFQAYMDKELKSPKENILLETITTIQCVSKHKFTNNSIELHCFEITTAASKSSNQGSTATSMTNPNMVMSSSNSGNTKMIRQTHLYGVAKESERYIWMQKLIDSMTDVFPMAYTSKFYRAGWCYLKNSITSQWSGAWLLLQKQKKRLLCYSSDSMNLECMDLRKARCLVLKDNDDSIDNLHVESGPILMIDCPPYSMYMIMSSPRETKIWRHILQEVAHNNGPTLKEQQLTKDNVSVLVDKCINFVYAHGSMSEGIYRKSGSEQSINKLMNLFRTDSFSVQITRTEYNEHDVANALKRFMRDLPDRLLGKYSISFISVGEIESTKEKLAAYKELLQRLPSIEYATLKKLLGHLNFIQSQCSRNKMNVENLAIVWGPTLLNQKQNDAVFSQKEADVLVDLIMLYKHLYQLTTEEIAKEKIMLTVLQKYHAAAETLSDSVKHSGDIRVWITIDPNPDNGDEDKQQINVTLTPTKTVYDICKELAPKIKKEAYAITLSEVILNGDLTRPLHYTEKVFDIVLKWSYWPESDRKNNFLRLQPMKFIKDIERALKHLPIVSPTKELKFADHKTKAFKSYTLELSNGLISVMKKDKSTIVNVKDIHLQRTTAYIGCEKKRDFQLRWAITLIENDQDTNILRTRDSPFIGHVIAGTNSNDLLVWYSSILHSLYGDDLMPNPEIIY